MSTPSGYLDWKMTRQISPIILTRGVEPGSGTPIVSLMGGSPQGQTAGFSFGSVLSVGIGLVQQSIATGKINGLGIVGNLQNNILTGGSNLSPQLDGYNANFKPLQGSTLFDLSLSQYPFANMAVAANAVIANPLHVSMLMAFPATSDFPYKRRWSVLTNLITKLRSHALAGGTYTVITPGFIYVDTILTTITDVSSDPNKPQESLKWDFAQPLVSQQAAAQAQNNLMQTLTNGTPIVDSPTWSSGLPVANPTATLTQSLSNQSLA